MQGAKQDIEIDENVTYSLASDSFNKPLKLTNKSAHIYVFKIKTNQRSVISMQVTHDFIKPNSVKEIVIKLAEKPSESSPLRLELNYVIPTEEEIRINDSKMNSYGKDAVFRRIVTITRDDTVKPVLSASASFSRKEETVLADQASINLSAISFKEEKKEEKREETDLRRKEEKEEARREEKETKNEEKFDPQLVDSTPVKYPDLSYIRQVESEQIEVVTGKSTEIDVTGLVEAPFSSDESAISAYSRSIDIASQAASSGAKPVIRIPSMEREDSFILAASASPSKKSQPVQRNFKSEEERALRELNEKLEREQATISKLKSEQTTIMSSDCVYPVPIVYLFVLVAFFGGALLNWIIL